MPRVATREGGVDRNVSVEEYIKRNDVATREGGVDRNERVACYGKRSVGRHPRGWRG